MQVSTSSYEDMRRLEWLLPKLSSPEVAALAPSDRLTLAVAGVDAWKLQEKTSLRTCGV